MATFALLTQILLLVLGIFLMIVILLQRGRGGGLAGAFGGLGGQSAFGTKAGDVFTKITIVIAVLWVLVSGSSGFILRKVGKGTRAQELGEVPASVSSGEGEDEAAGEASFPFESEMTPGGDAATPGGNESATESATPSTDSESSPPTEGADVPPADGDGTPASTQPETAPETGEAASKPAEQSTNSAAEKE